jgi:hypothetical protein
MKCTSRQVNASIVSQFSKSNNGCSHFPPLAVNAPYILPVENIDKFYQGIPEHFTVIDMIGFQFFPIAISRVFQSLPQVLNHFACNRFTLHRRIALVDDRFSHTCPDTFETIVDKIQKASALVGVLFPPNNVQVSQKVKQVIPAENIGANYLV